MMFTGLTSVKSSVLIVCPKTTSQLFREGCYRLKGLKCLQFTLGTEILILFKTEMVLKDLRIKI